MIPSRPDTGPAGRYLYRCEQGHELSLGHPDHSDGMPVCEGCTTPGSDPVFMELVQ